MINLTVEDMSYPAPDVEGGDSAIVGQCTIAWDLLKTVDSIANIPDDETMVVDEFYVTI